MKISNVELFDRILSLNDTLDSESSFIDPSRVKDAFMRLQNESNIQKYSKEQELRLVDDIWYGLAKGENEDDIFRHYGSTKHLNYFDNFFGEGETKKVLEALEKHGLSTDVLKGIKPYKPSGFKAPLNKEVQIKQVWSDGSDGSSPQPISFELYYKGEKIYSWYAGKDDKKSSSMEDLDLRKRAIYELNTKYEKSRDRFDSGATIVSETISTPDISYHESAYKTSTGKIKTRRQYAAGTVINGKNVGGRFF